MRKFVSAIFAIAVLFPALPTFAQTESSQPAGGDAKPATVVFYRYRAAMAALRRATINIDNREVASVVNGRWFQIDVPAGAHVITGPDKRKGADITLEPGETYYFRVVLNATGFMQARNIFTVVRVTPEEGKHDLPALQPLDDQDIHLKTLAPAAKVASGGGR
jgi:hypothetical protein